jgi:hypothetical protein
MNLGFDILAGILILLGNHNLSSGKFRWRGSPFRDSVARFTNRTDAIPESVNIPVTVAITAKTAVKSVAGCAAPK